MKLPPCVLEHWSDPRSQYADRLDYPAPYCRFVQEAELSAEMQALKVKERGDWKALTQADKKEFSPPLPHTMSDEWQEAQLRYQIAIRNGPVTGIASQWDYEKNEWKK
eukprot:XP_011667195.1 PREDICTED: cytochrome c oxidase subunit 4 isoform 1, mitochondrial-like [Strongylocentrotus purpuratus]